MEIPADHLTPESGSAPEKSQRRRHSLAFKERVLAEVLAGRESWNAMKKTGVEKGTHLFSEK